MASSVTITAKVGPGIQATAIVLPDVKNINFDFNAGTVQINYNDYQWQAFAFTNVAAVTWSVSGQNYTVTITEA